MNEVERTIINIYIEKKITDGNKLNKNTFLVPLAPGATSSCSTNIGGDTASFVFIIGTIFKLINSDNVQKRFFRVFSL